MQWAKGGPSGGIGERAGLDVADEMAGLDIAPGPAAGIFEHRERIARGELGDRLGVRGRRGADARRRDAGLAQQGPGVVGRENLPGQRDVGDVLAVGVDARIERQRRPGQLESLIRSGG